MTPFGTTVLVAVLVAFLIDLAVLAVGYCFGYRLYLGDAVRVLSGAATANLVPARHYDWLNDHPGPIFTYFFSTHILAFGLAWLWRYQLVRRFGLDRPSFRLHAFFRPKAPWHYLFAGVDVWEAVDGVLISVIVPLKDATYLFAGLLEDYELTAHGELDRIILSSAVRSNLNDALDESATDDQEIEGDRLILRASEWTTLNIKFLRLGPAN